MFNQSIVSDPELLASLSPVPLLELGGRDTTSLPPFSCSRSCCFHPLILVLRISLLLLLIYLYLFIFIRLFASGWYLITATDPPISATFSERHNALLLSRGWAAASWSSALGGKKGSCGMGARTRTRRHQEQRRIFSFSFRSLLLSLLPSLITSFCWSCCHRLYRESKYHCDPLSCVDLPNAPDMTPFDRVTPILRRYLSVNLKSANSRIGFSVY